METLLQYVNDLVPLETFCRLLTAVVAGGAIGWERERQDKPAGLRTHMLVSLGAAAFIIGAIELAADLRAENPAIRLDPIRALAGIIGGVGFLGAGTIIQSRGEVQGITTAASIWISAAIGTSCGMGRYHLAAICGLLALMVLWVLGRLEHNVIGSKSKSRSSSENE